MAKSYLSSKRLTRLEKKVLHKKNPTLVYGKGRRKYKSIVWLVRAAIKVCSADDRVVDWTDIRNYPELHKSGDGSVYQPSGGA